jgi:hypothetical protein
MIGYSAGLVGSIIPESAEAAIGGIGPGEQQLYECINQKVDGRIKIIRYICRHLWI